MYVKLKETQRFWSIRREEKWREEKRREDDKKGVEHDLQNWIDEDSKSARA